jgi:hypothetical protein
LIQEFLMKTVASAVALLAFLAANTLPSNVYAQPAQPATGAAVPAPESAGAAGTTTAKQPTHKATKHTAKKKTKSKPVKSSTNKKSTKKSTQSSLAEPTLRSTD